MKKVFLTMMMLLFAFTGVMRAQTLTVHDGSATNGFVPVYGYYADAYLKSEMVYPAAELSAMSGGIINSMTFEATQASVNWGTNFQVFLAEVSDATISTFAGPGAGTIVYEGGLSISGNEMVVTFSTPYNYGGGNLLVGVYQTNTGSYITSTWVGETVTGASVQGYSYSDLSSVNPSQRNFLPKTTFEYAAGGAAAVTTDPAVLDLGARPNGFWMAPFVFNLENTGGAINVTSFDFNNSYFTAEAELPAQVYAGNPLEVTVTTGEADPGLINTEMLVMFDGGSKNFETFNISATAYDPESPDVWELAEEVTSFPFHSTTAATLYKNYDLPGADAAAVDAVYEVTFDEDVLFSAGTPGANGVTVMYKDGFEGVGGPAADNYYDGSLEINPGPISTWFYYDYTGSTTWLGYGDTGGWFGGYKIPASRLQENGFGGLSLVTVETIARDNTPYELYVCQGTASGGGPDEVVAYKEVTNLEPNQWFDVNLDEPVVIDDTEDLWVFFYSECDYPTLCGKTPLDPDGSIWYSRNGSTWYSNATYTPLIYCHLLELPRGREMTVNFADMSIKKGENTSGTLAQVKDEVKSIAPAQQYMAAKKQNNRAVAPTTVLEEGWESGDIGSWTLNNCNSSTGVINSSSDAHTGDYCFRFMWTTSPDQYLISPVLPDNDGGTMSFYCRSYSGSWPESYKLGYSTTTNDPSAFTFGSEETITSALYAEKSFNFPAGTKYVAIACTSNDQFYFYVDDITITAEPVSGGGGGGSTFQIADMFVPAGTYYVAVASTDASFDVDMETAAVPVPEKPIIIAPYDGATGVSAPVLIEWILGDYTTEMQVLLGTQFGPTDILIDWTDELVESAFATDLEHNKTYFVQVNARNASGEVSSDVIGFTTVIDPATGLTVVSDKLYPGEAAEFSWDASNRSLKGYNLYKDGAKVNEELITGTEYAVEGLEYNMTGYNFRLTAVYDEGESEPTAAVVVKMTGNGTVSGTVYEQDETTVIPGATVSLRGRDEYNLPQEFTFTTAEDGTYTGELYAGTYTAYASKDGYQECAHNGDVVITYEGTTPDIDIIVYEYYFPLGMIRATEQTDENNVLVEWDWTPGEMVVDFETGDFSQAEFNGVGSYPWIVTTSNPHEGTYCMKSTCETIANGVSAVEATVDVPFDAKMGFWVKVSSESNYDKFHFYIDGVEQGAALSGNLAYAYKEFTVAQGTHTYKWEYAKDGSVNSNDDCVYVDDITMYREDVPAPPIVGGVSYDFEDQTMMGWTSLDADGDGYGWVSSGNPGQYHNAGVSLAGTGHESSQGYVISGSYSNSAGVALYPDNFLIAPSKITAEAGALITFYACAQDANYAAEHFGVAVSTTNNTSASSFTTIQEWTLSAKGVKTSEDHGLIRGTRAQGNWYQYTVDLSDYAGQEIWVALRHFNCTDMFILNIDDITLADGSAKSIAMNDRTFQHFNLYRRNNIDEASVANPVLINQPAADVFEYIDNAWDALPFGVYQWGISACYEGNAPTDRDAFTYDFEGNLNGWTVLTVNSDGGEWLHSNNNPGGYDYTTLAHGGTGFAMCYSYVDYVGAYNTNSYLVSPQKYSITTGSNITFWADNANDSYPEDFSVCVSTAATPTASSFTEIWNGGAKGNNNGNAVNRHLTNRYENWRSHDIDLSAYAGQEIWIAFHDVNYDAYEIWIDDVTITTGGAPVPPPAPVTGDGESEIIWSNEIEKDMYSTVTVNVTLNNGQPATGVTVAMVGESTFNATLDETGSVTFEDVRKGAYELTVSMTDFNDYVATVDINEDEQVIDVMLEELVGPVVDLYVSPTGWAKWQGPMPGNNNGGTTPVGPSTGDEFSVDFESGTMPTGWTTIDADGDSYDWTMAGSTMGTGYGHNGSSDMIFSQSYDNNVGVLYPDNYLVTPQVNLGSTSVFSFWACGQDANYAAEHFGVAISTTGNTSASDFTMLQEWTMTAKANGPKGPRGTNAQGNWYQYTVDLGAYAGQQAYIAIRHFNCSDMFYLDVDDIALANGSKGGDRSALSYKVMLDGAYAGETEYACFQHDVEGMEEGSVHTTQVAPIFATGMGDWTSYTWTYIACDHYNGATNVNAVQDGVNVNISFTLPEGSGGGGGGGTTPGEGQWYYYGDDIQTTGVGAGAQFYWAVMFPAGYYTGNMVTKVANFGAHDDLYGTNGAFSGTVTIYNDGTSAPANAVGTMNISMPDTDELVEFEFPDPVVIDPTKNLWVVFYNATSTDYVGSCCNDAGDPNGRWVSLDGSSWMDLATAGVPGYNWMIRAYVAQGTKNNVVSILDPMQPISNPGTLAMAPRGSRAMWDLVYEFDGTSGYQYGVASDGTNIYTSSWSSSSTSMFYKYDMDGNFIEEFNISGCGQCRGLTYDGEYFYGVANSSTVYCIDLANKTLVSTFTTSYGAMRCITYDPQRDGFWVVGNWSGNLTLIDHTGAIVQAGPAPTSASDVAYFKDDDNVEHVLCFNNGDNGVYDYNITTNTLSSSAVFNFNTNPNVTGSSGGCFVGPYNGKTCFFGDIQQSPQHIAIYELSESGAPVPPPTPSGDVLGAMIFRDGELITGEPVTETFVDANAPSGEHEYCVRVVYSDWSMSCPECAQMEYECIPVEDLVGEYTWNSDSDYGVTLDWTCPQEEFVQYYTVYYCDTIAFNTTEHPFYVEMTGNPGEYTFSVTAVYANCESEPATVDVNVTSVNEFNDNVTLYPNPTSSTVTINAQGMKHITVVNALGQMVYDADITADVTTLNLGQFKAGIYMVRINTETGISVKRVTVVK